MPVKVAAHITAIPASPTLSLSAKVKELQADGKDVIDLSAGEPDFPLPKVFADGITNALNKGQTTYPPVPGIMALRAAVAADLSARHGMTYTAEQIVVGTGAKQPLALAFQIVLGEGDEAIVPTPFWVSYADQVRLCRANPILVECSADTNYKLTPQKLRAAITPKTKAIILGSPSNPTGAVYTADELKALGVVLKEFPDMLIIADQIYDQLIYDGQKAPSIVGVMPELAAQTIIIDGMSKAYAATGLRLGWATGPVNLIKTIATVQGHMTSGACSIIQHGALAMLQAPDRAQQIATMVSAYQKRRDALMAKLQAEPRLKIFKPAGAFYLWCNIEAFGMADNEFCNRMLEENGVAAVPGSAFGSPGHIRIHFAAGDATLASAAERILAFCGGLK